MSQTKKQSFIEANTSTFLGFIVSYTLSYTVLPLYGVEQSHSVSFQITLIYTIASIFRGYFVRRYFNNKKNINKYLDVTVWIDELGSTSPVEVIVKSR